MANKRGRPTIFTQAIANKICRDLSEGMSLRAICRDEKMPAHSTVLKWLLEKDKKAFYDQYTHAREAQADVLFDETLELADDTPDVIVGDDKSDNARVQAHKLRVDTRKWYLSKVLPKKYGEKLDVTTGGESLNQYRELSDEELAKRRAQAVAFLKKK